MATYRQKNSFAVEDDFGEQVYYLIVADSYGGLSATAEPIDIITSKSLKSGLEDDAGSLIQDEIDYIIDESTIETEAELNCLNLIKSAINPEIKVYFALYFQNEAELNVDKRLFIGLISSDIKFNDLFHNNPDSYVTEPEPVQIVEFTANTFQDRIFDEIKFADLTEKMLIVTPENDFITKNVYDRLSYYNYYDDLSLVVYNNFLADLVELNKIIRKYADLVCAEMQSIIPGFTIQFNECELGFELLPVRWGSAKWDTKPVGYIKLRTLEVDRYVEQAQITFPNDKQKIIIRPDYTFDDYSVSNIGKPNNIATADYFKESIFIDFKQFINNNPVELDSNLAKNFLWEKQIENFSQFMYTIASNLGLYLRMYYTDETTLQIDFLSGKNFVSSNFFIKDAVQVSTDVSTTDAAAQYDGIATYYCDNGYSSYYYDSKAEYNNIKSFDSNEKMLMTISPSVRVVSESEPIASHNFANKLYDCQMPHNSLFKRAGLEYDKPKLNARGVHSAIYMYVIKHPDDNNELTPGDYFTPACGLVVREGGVDKTFGTLEEFLKFKKTEDKKFRLKYSITIECPFWNGFAYLPGGADASIHNLKLGNVLNWNGLEYVLIEVDINLMQPNVKLKLVAKSYYNRFEEALTSNLELIDGSYKDTDYTQLPVKNDLSGKQYVLIEDIGLKGDVISQVDGVFKRALPNEAHYDIIGIAITDYNNNLTEIQTDGYVNGSYVNGWSTLPIGNKMFLQAGTGCNIGIYPIVPSDITNNLYAIIGTKINDSEFKIDIKQFILEK